MRITTRKPDLQHGLPQISWWLVAIIVGALGLIIGGLLFLPQTRRPIEFAPLSTPEGVVQRFLDATYRDDYLAAYDLLSKEAQERVSLTELQQRLRYNRDSELRVAKVTTYESSATVTLLVREFSPGGIFGGSEWSYEILVQLERDGDSWKIVDGLFW